MPTLLDGYHRAVRFWKRAAPTATLAVYCLSGLMSYGPVLDDSQARLAVYVAANRAQKVSVPVNDEKPGVPLMKIVPADVMSRDAAVAPLTGDGSN